MWHYAKDQQRHGPVSQDEVVGLLRAGALADHDLVWREGMAGWTAAGEVTELQQARFAARAAPMYAAGAVQPVGPVATAAPTSGLAIASLVLGLVSFVVGTWILTAIPGVICGHKARRQIRESPFPMEGAGMATAGLVMGYIVIGLTLLVILGILAVFLFVGVG
jgi:hypothetical protein